MQKIPMTTHSFKELSKELKYLINIKRVKIINSITDARKHGDLKENFEYFAAKEQQKFCEKRIKNIKIKLSNAQIINIKKNNLNNYVTFGATVTIKSCNKKTKIYRIVGDDEADIKKNLLSINSPIAKGLIGKKIGVNVIVYTPNGYIKYRIIDILYI